MANLLRKIESVAYQPETLMIQRKFNPLKNEVIENIEELSKEINYLKNKVKLMVSSENDKEELTDTIYKLRDLRNSVESRKQRWERLMHSMDISLRLETAKAMEMLKSTTEKLEDLLEEAMRQWH